MSIVSLSIRPAVVLDRRREALLALVLLPIVLGSVVTMLFGPALIAFVASCAWLLPRPDKCQENIIVAFVIHAAGVLYLSHRLERWLVPHISRSGALAALGDAVREKITDDDLEILFPCAALVPALLLLAGITSGWDPSRLGNILSYVVVLPVISFPPFLRSVLRAGANMIAWHHRLANKILRRYRLIENDKTGGE